MGLARRRRMGEGSTAGVPWGAGGRGMPLAYGRAPAQPGVPLRHCTHGAYETPCAGVDLGHPVNRYLAGAGRREGWRVGSKLQMAEDLANDLPLRDDGYDAQRPLMAQRAASPIQRKDPLEQPCP